MANGARLTEVIYSDTGERQTVCVGIGDAIIAEDWAEAEYPYPPKPDLHEGLSQAEIDFNREEYREAKFAVDRTREIRGGLYALFLGAERARLRGTEQGWRAWLSMITVPQEPSDGAPEGAVSEGESGGPPSAA
jgi:hypothetical protein